MSIVRIRGAHYHYPVPIETLCLPPCSLVLQLRPEMTVDKQWEQTVTPTSIDLALLPLPSLTNNTTLIPPTLNLYESPGTPPPFLPRLTKMMNDRAFLSPLPCVGCPSHYKPISTPVSFLFLGSSSGVGYSLLQVLPIISTYKHVIYIISTPQDIHMYDVN